MRIKQTSRLVTAGVVILSTVTIACALVSRQFRTMQEHADATRLAAFRAAAQLAEGSDRLTAGVRAYAATGERRYLDEFDRELKVDRSRDKAIEQLNQMGLATFELSLLNDAKRNSDNLVKLENRAFAAAGRRDFTTAIALVYGEEYRKAKASIMEPIAECQKTLEARLAREAEDLAARAQLLSNIALGLVFATVLAIIAALFFFYGKRVVNPLAALNQSLRELLARQRGVTIPCQKDQSEIGEVARSLESYRRAAEVGEGQRWAKTVLAEVVSLLQTADTTDEFARRLTSGLVPAVHGACGALFLFDERTRRFQFAGGYCYQKRPDLSTSFAVGESLVGQCAKEQKTITLTDIPANYIRIVSGVGEAPPRAIVLVPFMSRGSVAAILEIASFLPLTDQESALVHEAANIATLALEVLLRNLKTRELLDQVNAAEVELQTQHSALEAAANAIAIVDRNGTIEWVNQAFTRLTGFARDEAIGQNPRVLKSGTHGPEFYQHMWRTVTSGSVWQGTLTNKRKDGQLYQEEMTITPVRSRQGDITHFVAIKQDITERLQAEERLRETDQFFRSVLELAPDGLMVADPDGVIRLANAQCEKLFGYTRDELIGQPVEMLLPEEVRARHPGLRQAFHDSPAIREMGSGRELRARRKDGSVFSVEIGLSPLPACRGERTQVAVSIRDITERQRAEGRLGDHAASSSAL
jgi:PAS domain S-box-containing protein